MSIIADLKEFTSSICFDCCSMHCMPYYSSDDIYECEECYEETPYDALDVEMLTIDWNKLTNYILMHPTPKKVIKIFIVKILHQEYEEPDVDVILYDLQNGNDATLRALHKNYHDN